VEASIHRAGVSWNGGEGERTPRAAEQAQHRGGTFDRLDGSGHRTVA
jgi:hypothetical protein